MDQSVKWGNSISYALPKYSDAEGNAVTLKTVQDGYPDLPSFVKFDSDKNTYDISPSALADIGSFKISVILSDTALKSSYIFVIEVTNSAPSFSSDLLPQTVSILNTITYQVPSFSDPEGNPVTLTTTEKDQIALPSFVIYDESTTTYIINPMDISLIGTTTTIAVSLTDND